MGKHLSNATSYCVSNVYNWILFSDLRAAEYDTLMDFLESFSQNLVGSLFNLNNLIQSMQVAIEEGDMIEFYEIIGRLIYIVQKFEPVETLLL